MICDAGDVVIVPFPFVDQPISKVRPSLVLSVHTFNAADHQTVLAMITTAAASRWGSDTPIVDWTFARLRTPCVVRMKVFTLENRLVVRQLGRLSEADWSNVRERLRAVFPALTAD